MIQNTTTAEDEYIATATEPISRLIEIIERLDGELDKALSQIEKLQQENSDLVDDLAESNRNRS